MKSFFNRLREVWIIIGITFLCLILIEVFFKFYYVFNSEDDSRLNADCYKNVSWSADYFSEFSACNVEEWKSYVYWRRKPFSDKHINIEEDQTRKTVFNKSNNPTYSIFIFGGSTMWGTGVRDKFTIPSQLGEGLSQNGFDVDITNFGESGYVSTQEVIELSLQLQKGNIPDLVIFYDGVNDVFSAYQQGEAGIPQNEYNRVAEFNTLISKKKSGMVFIRSLKSLATMRFIFEFMHKSEFKGILYTEMETKNLAQNVIYRYNENIRIVNALAKEYGFNTIFYWQPTIFTKPNLSDYEQQVTENVKYIKDFVNNVNSQMVKKEVHEGNLHFYDISDIFHYETKGVYIDYCHISEYGNSIIADRMKDNVISIFKNVKK